MLIGINGRLGSGKDETAKTIQRLTAKRYSVEDEFGNMAKDIDGSYLVEYRNTWEIEKFAGKLKLIASILTGFSVEKFEDQSFKASYLPSEWNDEQGNQMTVRSLLQRLGTDCVRDNLHKNTWVNALFSNQQFKTSNIIVTDMRFPNEYNAVKERGGIVIKVIRKENNVDSSTLHESETALDGHKFDWIIDNSGDLKHLENEVKEFLRFYNLLPLR